MFEIYFYRDRKGNEPVKQHLDKLEEKSIKSKDSRVKYNKILQYLKILRTYGTMAGEPYMKHIEGDIWELRPLRDRILFFGWKDNMFILLTCFMKSTQKTPRKEIEKAKRCMEDFIKRSEEENEEESEEESEER